MIGAAVFELRAHNAGRLPFINGRFMHAVFFKILNEFSQGLGNFVHNEMNIKPFTVSFLEPVDEIPLTENHWHIRRGEKFLWRVTGLNAEILQAIVSVPIGYKVQAGTLTLRVEKLIDETTFTVEEFLSRIKNSPPIRELCFEFVSPTTFRIDDFDAPYPRADLIFGSLADKWTQAAMPANADKKIIREFATQLRLTEWHGQSKKFYFTHERGTAAFWGKFFYSVEDLSADIKKVFMLLAKFGEFAGVGRLTGQGFGQTRIKFVQ